MLFLVPCRPTKSSWSNPEVEVEVEAEAGSVETTLEPGAVTTLLWAGVDTEAA